ncbi:MAG: hypothetical protein KDD60_11365, partial [Bdellovibrionales bacterium]|nr:hypothetical protein [Bdellovibrionales bacterium]
MFSRSIYLTTFGLLLGQGAALYLNTSWEFGLGALGIACFFLILGSASLQVALVMFSFVLGVSEIQVIRSFGEQGELRTPLVYGRVLSTIRPARPGEIEFLADLMEGEDREVQLQEGRTRVRARCVAKDFPWREIRNIAQGVGFRAYAKTTRVRPTYFGRQLLRKGITKDCLIIFFSAAGDVLSSPTLR